MSAKRILVTGASGFVGAVLARRALELGHEVHVLLRQEGVPWRLRGIEGALVRHAADLADEESVRRAVAQARPEVVYHLAAHGAYPFQTDADRIIQTNMLGTWNLLKATARSGYEVFVNAGSSSEYGFKDFAMRETDLLEPNSYYSVSKCAQTLLCQHFARAEKQHVTTLRLFSVYGPYEEKTRLVPLVIRRALANEELVLVPPETARDFVYVDDIVAAFFAFDRLAALSGEIVNLGTGVQSTVKEVVDAVLAATGSRSACRWGAMAPRIWDSTVWVADCTKSRRLLGWHATTSLEEGISRTVAWTRERGETT